jgi:DNA-binding response OmpR family regulator
MIGVAARLRPRWSKLESRVGWDPVRVTHDTSMLAVLAVSDSDAGAAVRAHVERAGYTVAASPERGVDVLGLLADPDVDLVVIEVPLLGSFGFRLLSAIRLLRPGCLVVLLDPLGSSEPEGIAAGADAVLGTADLSGFRAVLRDAQRGADGPVDQAAPSEARGSRRTN